MILNHLQGRLESQYDLVIPYDVDAFVSHDLDVARQLFEATDNKDQAAQQLDVEVVFIRQDEDVLEFTLYLDEDLLQSVSSSVLPKNTHRDDEAQLAQPSVDDLCTLVEGVSHAVCLLWHAHNDRQIRPVDLELQAEIDKFLLLTGQCHTPTEHRHLHRQLFTDCQLTPTPGTAVYERYRIANDLAARYCHWLTDTFVTTSDQVGLDSELARFYRLSGNAKFDRIKRLH